MPDPGKDPFGTNLRRIFIARPGFKIVEIDYAGVELRIAGNLSKDPTYLEMFSDGNDPHRVMASKIFGVEPEKVTKTQRAIGKEVNFSCQYFGTPDKLKMDFNEKLKLSRQWLGEVPVYRNFIDRGLRRFFSEDSIHPTNRRNDH